MIATHIYIPPAPHQNRSRSHSATKQQVLIVADKVERDSLAGHLSSIAEVSFAQNDQEAIRMLGIRVVHLVIADETVGEHGLCWYIKNNCLYAHIPVVELISRDSPASRLQCLESGADAWLEKPVSRHFLLAQINNLLMNRARIRECLAIANPIDVPVISPIVRSDEALWKRLNQVITQHISDAALDIDFLARHLYMSRPTLYRKIAETSNMSPSELITQIRLDNAAALLSLADYPIGDIARMVGFITRSGFGKAFHKRFQMSPSDFRQKALAQALRDDLKSGYPGSGAQFGSDA